MLRSGPTDIIGCKPAGEKDTRPSAVDAVDTTGAGDAFHGAFVLALSQGLGDEECARVASAVAALKCRKLGARAGLPTASELDALLREQIGRGTACRRGGA